MNGKGFAVKALACLLGLAAALALVVVVVLDPASSSSAAGCTAVASTTSGATQVAAGGALAGLDGEAQTNARIVAAVVVARHLPARALVVLDAAALDESGLHNDDYGDEAGPDSRGILQQRDSWGPLSVRMDPAGAAGLFLDRLVNVAGWQGLDPWVAAQDVQVSAYDGHPRAANNYSTVVGGNYLAKTEQAIALTQELYADPGLTLICGSNGGSGGSGPVPVAIRALPAPPAPYTGPAGGGPCDVPDGGGCIREATAHLRAAVLAAFPAVVRSVGCYSGRPGDHGTGAACDFMITTGAAAAGQDLVNGWTVAAWLRANAAALDVAYVIWELRIWDARHPQPDDNAGWGQPYAGCSYCPSILGDPSAAHTNHVHVSIQSPDTE
jgi:hypothetical protein